MAQNRTSTEQQLIAGEHCLMSNELSASSSRIARAAI
jgi:hypothetical protein